MIEHSEYGGGPSHGPRTGPRSVLFPAPRARDPL